MSDTPDPVLLAGFFEESEERLGSLDPLFVRLEGDPGDREAIEAIFRAIHTLKGNSGFFGFTQMQEVAHAVEDVLDAVRTGRQAMDPRATDAVLAGADVLRRMIDRLRGGGPEVDDPQAIASVIAEQRAVLAPSPATPDMAVPQAVARMAAAMRELPPGPAHAAWSALAALLAGDRPADRSPGPPPAALATVRTLIASDSPRDAAAAAALRQGLRTLAAHAIDPDGRGYLRRLNTECEELLDAAGFMDVVADLVRDRLDALPAGILWSATPIAGDEVPQPSVETAHGSALNSMPGTSDVSRPETRREPGSGREPRTDRHETRTDVFARADGKKTLRVPEDRIDSFLAHVGDLLVVSDLFRHLLSRLGDGSGLASDGRAIAADLRRAVTDFDRLSGDLQRAIMRVRQVPVKQVLAKVPRLVRDVARARGKSIAVRTSGEEIELDKSLCDLLDGPLVHLVRNAADHGIEDPATRNRRGKPMEGTISVAVSLTEQGIVMTIEDDGGGLDHARIQAKAVQQGIVAADARLSEDELNMMIFAPGFSTAAQVTEISGRGVGLDVVKSAVDGAGGTVRVGKRPGKGCTFTVTVPRAASTQILPGFLVSVAGLRLVLPLACVRETARMPRSSVSEVSGQGQCVIRHDHVISLIDLRTRLCGNDPGGDDLLAVTVEMQAGPVALVVDEVLGVQQVVLRPIQGVSGIPAGFAGGALLGDGTVALVADIEQLVAH
jgi:two-component system chemotaxis sensor kinase CheA